MPAWRHNRARLSLTYWINRWITANRNVGHDPSTLINYPQSSFSTLCLPTSPTPIQVHQILVYRKHSMEIHASQHIALVGAMAAGRTLANILLRFMNNQWKKSQSMVNP